MSPIGGYRTDSSSRKVTSFTHHLSWMSVEVIVRGGCEGCQVGLATDQQAFSTQRVLLSTRVNGTSAIGKMVVVLHIGDVAVTHCHDRTWSAPHPAACTGRPSQQGGRQTSWPRKVNCAPLPLLPLFLSLHLFKSDLKKRADTHQDSHH